MVREGEEGGSDAGQDPGGADCEGGGVLEDEHSGRVLAEEVQGGAEKGEGVDEVDEGDSAVQPGVLDAGEAPEREVVGGGREGPAVQYVGGEGRPGADGEVRVAGGHEGPKSSVGLRGAMGGERRAMGEHSWWPG